MPFAHIDMPCQVIAAHAYAETSSFEKRGLGDNSSVVGIWNELEVAKIRYPIRQPIRTSYIPSLAELLAEGYSPVFVGHGSTIKEAANDFRESVHYAFQNLLYKRPFEMSAEEVRQWRVLSDQIDVTVYRNTTLIHTRQYGTIAKVRQSVTSQDRRFGSRRQASPSQIEWESGSKESVTLDQVDDPNFVTYKPGQPIEAIVARDPLTFELIRIVHIVRCKPPSRLPAKQESELLNSIGSADRLESTDWD